jgi:Flp pilus assembly protein TadD
MATRAYAATPEEIARIRSAADNGRRVAGSGYLGAAVPDTADVHNELGIAMAARGQLDAAIAEFRQALALDPDSADTHWHLGAALAETGALKEAVEHLRTSVQLDPENVDARHDLESVAASRRR